MLYFCYSLILLINESFNLFADLLLLFYDIVLFRDRITWIGATAEDEMCNFYMMYWVEGDQVLNGEWYYILLQIVKSIFFKSTFLFQV